MATVRTKIRLHTECQNADCLNVTYVFRLLLVLEWLTCRYISYCAPTSLRVHWVPPFILKPLLPDTQILTPNSIRYSIYLLPYFNQLFTNMLSPKQQFLIKRRRNEYCLWLHQTLIFNKKKNVGEN